MGDERARKERERKNESREHSREGSREAGEGERTRVREHARERARMSKRGTERKEERGNGAGTTTAAMGASSQQRQQWGLRGRGLERPAARHRRPGEYRLDGCTCSTVVRRGTERESSYHRRHCSPKRRLAKGGGMREFTTRFSTARASARMRFKEMAPFFSEYLNRQLLRP